MSKRMAGTEVIRRAWRYQNQIEKATKHALEEGQLGQRARRLFDAIGASLLLLMYIASCHWRCRQQDHTVENVVRKGCNFGFSALRLSCLGFYDEALALVRSLAELGNLLQLFVLDPLQLQAWAGMGDAERRKQFSPLKVRLAIESKSWTPATPRHTYNKLCEIGVHATPSSVRLSHDLYGRKWIGGEFSVPGLLLVWGQLARSIAPMVTTAGQLVGAHQEQKELERSSQELSDSAGWLSVDNYEAFFDEFRSNYFRDTALIELSGMTEAQFEEIVSEVISKLVARGRLPKPLEEMSQDDAEAIVYSAIVEELVQGRGTESRTARRSSEKGPNKALHRTRQKPARR